MNSSDIPSRTTKAFSVNGDKNSIPVDSTGTTLADGDATFDSGFPPLTMTPIGAGGKPPKGKDMNGILYAITQKQQWQDAGMGYPYNAAFSTSITGYPKGALIPNSTYSGVWINLTEANANNPEVSTATATGWVPLGGYGDTAITMTSTNTTLTTLQASKERIVISGALTANLYLYFPPWLKDWTIENKATGAFSVVCTTTAVGAVGVTSYPKSVIQIHCDGTNMSSYSSPHGMSTYTASGTFVVPQNVTSVKVTCTAGGAGGMGCQANSTSQTFSGSGGGAGGTSIGIFQVSPGASISVVVGAGGGGSNGPSVASNGGGSSFGSLCSAAGGLAGLKPTTTNTAGGDGGGAAGGYINIPGGFGSDGQAGASLLTGSGGASYWGGGGRAGAAGGIAAAAYGAGGGGAYDSGFTSTSYSGGGGKSGVVTIEW
ncbi:glycine-rich domain-containing protein [Serratia quinivorans]|uniref:glycine-rich domain-containing protein n=1 Tax=Serratia quinivorans TaxID=137545 RepID=UPI003F986DB8